MQPYKPISAACLSLAFLLFLSMTVFAVDVDPSLLKTYNAMHQDCMSDEYLDDKLLETLFIEADLLEVMSLLRDRDIQGLAEKYLDPKLLKKKRRKLEKKYKKWALLLDLKGRGLSLEDVYNADIAANLLVYRYMHYAAAGYGLIPEKSWEKINARAWRLTFSYDKKTEHFYFRKIDKGWYLSDDDFIGN